MISATGHWTGPVLIDKREYVFPRLPDQPTDGMHVWPVAVALAHEVAGLKLQGKSVEIGAGCGLVGMVAGATLIEADARTVAVTRETLKLNGSKCDVLEVDWNTIEGQWDNILGSEIHYPVYKPPSVADFIERCWTGNGVCLFACATNQWGYRFEEGLTKSQMEFVYERRMFQGLTYHQWRLTKHDR